MRCVAGMCHDNYKHASLVAAQWRRCRSSEDDANAATNMNGMAPKTEQLRSALTLFIGFMSLVQLVVALNGLPAARSAA